jgi:hypothetical protein
MSFSYPAWLAKVCNPGLDAVSSARNRCYAFEGWINSLVAIEALHCTANLTREELYRTHAFEQTLVDVGDSF